MDKADAQPTESLGQRIGRLRTQLGWTQADLAARIAVSRVAISHFEMGLAIPSERTIVLLAGLFKMEPAELVVNTSYPAAKRERLPAVACRYTELEHQVALLLRDIAWIACLVADGSRDKTVATALQRCGVQLCNLRALATEPTDRVRVIEIANALRQLERSVSQA